MMSPGLSAEALMRAATELCQGATWSLAIGDSRRSRALVGAAAALVRRRKQAMRALDRPAPIIVVDDDECTREVVTELLVEEGYSVLCFSNGRDALAHL